MKKIFSFYTLSVFLLSFLILESCGDNDLKLQKKAAQLQMQIDSAKTDLTPGLGEFMNTVQLHHAKLWFAGTNKNWKLANYEIGELRETFEQAKKVETTRPEVKSIPIIYPPLDSLQNSINRKDLAAFKKNFHFLTNTCNTCHTDNHFEFNVIKIPSAPPVTNQEFK
jgi:hypothetical protein